MTEQTIGGTSFVRVDVPAVAESPGFTKLFSAGSIYCISPTTEELATGYQRANGSSPPITQYDLPEDVRNAIRAGRGLIEAAPSGISDGDYDEEY